MTDDTSDDGKWLTYQQLAEARRISKPSAIRLVMRHRWRRQRDNERVVRVLVPPAMLEPDHAPYDASDDVSGDASHDTSLVAGALAVLEDAVAALREQLDAANATAERAQADRADERLRADRAEAAIGVERQRADALRDRVTAMQSSWPTPMPRYRRRRPKHGLSGPKRTAPTSASGQTTCGRRSTCCAPRLTGRWQRNSGQTNCRPARS